MILRKQEFVEIADRLWEFAASMAGDEFEFEKAQIESTKRYLNTNPDEYLSHAVSKGKSILEHQVIPNVEARACIKIRARGIDEAGRRASSELSKQLDEAEWQARDEKLKQLAIELKGILGVNPGVLFGNKILRMR